MPLGLGWLLRSAADVFGADVRRSGLRAESLRAGGLPDRRLSDWRLLQLLRTDGLLFQLFVLLRSWLLDLRNGVLDL